MWKSYPQMLWTSVEHEKIVRMGVRPPVFPGRPWRLPWDLRAVCRSVALVSPCGYQAPVATYPQ